MCLGEAKHVLFLELPSNKKKPVLHNENLRLLDYLKQLRPNRFNMG